MNATTTPRARTAQENPCIWKTSERGNPYLSYYGLKITLFQRGRGWAVCIAQNDVPPTFENFNSNAEARAFAERRFLTLKKSGKARQVRLPETFAGARIRVLPADKDTTMAVVHLDDMVERLEIIPGALAAGPYKCPIGYVWSLDAFSSCPMAGGKAVVSAPYSYRSGGGIGVAYYPEWYCAKVRERASPELLREIEALDRSLVERGLDESRVQFVARPKRS